MATAANHSATNGAREAHDTQALVPYEEHSQHNAGGMAGGMVMPVATPQQARLAVEAFEALKSSLASPSDMILMKGGRIFLRKPFWRRVARAFGLDVHLVSEERRIDADGSLSYSVIYRAIAPNGATMDGDGFCSTSELSAPTNTEHNCRARAHTRAKNRAISDLVGGGEVSADELTDAELEEVRRNTSGQSSTPRPQQQQSQHRPTPSVVESAEPTSPWKALSDPDVVALLKAMDYSTAKQATPYLAKVKREMEAASIAWTRDQVMAQLRSRLREMQDEASRSGESDYVDAEDEHDDVDENDLSTIETGAPGN